jgi:hypothetical protein
MSLNYLSKVDGADDTGAAAFAFGSGLCSFGGSRDLFVLKLCCQGQEARM